MAELILVSFWGPAAILAGWVAGFCVAVGMVLRFAKVDKVTGDWFL